MMRPELRAAAVQMDVVPLDAEANLDRMIALIEDRLAKESVDLVVFPELANIGYVGERNRAFGREYAKRAETVPGRTTNALAQVAWSRGIHIVVGLAERDPTIAGLVYDSAVLIGPEGLAGTYRKIHIAGEEKHLFAAGHSCGVFDCELGKIGVVICYDLLFPELTRLLALGGAEMFCVPFNAPENGPSFPDRLEFLSRSRSVENGAFTISANRIGVCAGTTFSGNSIITGPSGTVLAQAKSRSEEVLAATLTADHLYEARAYVPVLMERRPDVYGALAKAAP